MNAPITSARLEGNTVRDLINALSLMDRDAVTEITGVSVCVTKRRELVLTPDVKKQVADLRDKVEEVLEWLDDETLGFEERVTEARAACKIALLQ